MTGRADTQRGMALALVLGAFIVLSLLAVGLIAVAGKHTTQARVALDRAQAGALADGAVNAAIHSLFDPEQRGRLRAREGRTVMAVADHEVAVTVRDACALWDINTGALDVFEALLRQLGSPAPGLAVKAVSDGRGIEAGFVSVDQIAGLPGIGPEIHDTLKHEVTVNCRADRIDPEFASPVLLKAIPGLSDAETAEILAQRGRDGPPNASLTAHARYLAPGAGHTYVITATVSAGPGARIHRRAEVTVGHDPHAPYRVVAWRDSE